jgi:hypothetical protein
MALISLLNYNLQELMVMYLDKKSKNKIITINILNIDLQQKMMCDIINKLEYLYDTCYFVTHKEFESDLNDNMYSAPCPNCNYIFYYDAFTFEKKYDKKHVNKDMDKENYTGIYCDKCE